jgi:hypothetical protein
MGGQEANTRRLFSGVSRLGTRLFNIVLSLILCIIFAAKFSRVSALTTQLHSAF